MSELELTFTTISIDPFVVFLITNIIKELMIKIFEMILRFHTYVISAKSVEPKTRTMTKRENTRIQALEKRFELLNLV